MNLNMLRKTYMLREVNEPTEVLLRQLPTDNFFSDVLVFDISSKMALHNMAHDISKKLPQKLLSTNFDKEVIYARQGFIRDLSSLLDTSKSESYIWALIHSTTELKEIFNPLNMKDPDLRQLGPLYYSYATSLRNLAQILKRYDGTRLFGEYMDMMCASNKEIIEGAGLFSTDSYILNPGYDIPNSIVTLKEDSLIKGRTIDYSRLYQNSLNIHISSSSIIEKVSKLFYETENLVDSLKAFYVFSRYFLSRKQKNKPVCFPIINDDRVFSVVDGVPIASSFHDKTHVPLNEQYTQDRNHFIYSGAHSGGKTHKLVTTGLYHWMGLMGFPLPAESVSIPFLQNIRASIVRNNVYDGRGKGSLESEVQAMMELSKRTGDDDLVLVDEFFDTTKPEFAKYVSIPILQMFDKSKSSVHIVYHAAASIYQEKTSFIFKHPIIKSRLIPEQVHVRSSERYNSYELKDTGKMIEQFYNSFEFAEGIPDGKSVQNHIMQQWKQIQDEHKRRY